MPPSRARALAGLVAAAAAAAAAAAVSVGSASAAAAAAPKPHIVVIAVDDFGWNDWGVHAASQNNSAEIITPRMDALAASGRILERHYVFRFCSPSRSALHSGRNPVHVNVLNSDLALVNLADPVSGFAGMPRNITALPQMLKDAGYHTVQAGK